MYLFYVISAFLVIAGYLTTSGGNRADATAMAALRTQATHHWVYHRAAREFCENNVGYCNTARNLSVTQVDDYLPVMTVSAGRLTSGRYAAFTDGAGNVVTVNRDLTGLDGSQAVAYDRSVVGSMLKEIVPDYVYAGPYDRANQRVFNLRAQAQFLSRTPVWGTLYDETPVILTDY